ncbi:ArsR/SmtB family transcription factor [Actinopolyspora saharensis]|uniref:ArsR/SmtB family transcription factor n=1 Tax=Actinopolyspora saharensis TaxID=995062 RepID=UPI003F66975B
MASRTASPLVHPREEEMRFLDVVEALSDPLRLGIVAALAETPNVPCGGFDLPVGKSASSRHFRILRESGVLHQWDEGTRRLNALRKPECDRRFPGLLDLAIAEGRRCQVGVTHHPAQLPSYPRERLDSSPSGTDGSRSGRSPVSWSC